MKFLSKGIAASLIAASLFMFSCSSPATEDAVDEVAEETVENTGAFTGTIEIMPEDATLGWVGKKVTGQHNGSIALQSGSVEVVDGAMTGAEFVIDMSTITVEDIEDTEMNADLTGHLKSDDFFGVESNPTATLSITGADAEVMYGDLTIKGITNDIKIPISYSIAEDGTFGMKGSMTVDRTLYDIKYGSGKFFEDLGDKMIYDEFTVDFKVVK